ncbi:MAG: VOC family protein [Gemmatimonadota bacterium]
MRPSHVAPLIAALVITVGMDVQMIAAQVPATAKVGIDHLIIGSDDLERGMAEFERRTGVRPVKGGVHPGRGTQNALASLGDGAYVEIMAPSHEPGTTIDARTRSPTLIPVGWALHTEDMASVVSSLRAAGLAVSAISPGARARPDGTRLEWQTAGVSGDGLEAAPFFIAWGRTTAHPSTESPTGCRLVRVAMTEPSPVPLQRFLDLSGVPVRVTAAPKSGMTMVLQCPAGTVTFETPR